MSTQMNVGFSASGDTLEDRRTQELPDDGGHERFSHFVPKAELTDAIINGTPVIALCGKVWVPSRDPKKYPVCPECQEIWDGFKPGKKDPDA